MAIRGQYDERIFLNAKSRVERTQILKRYRPTDLTTISSYRPSISSIVSLSLKSLVCTRISITTSLMTQRYMEIQKSPREELTR